MSAPDRPRMRGARPAALIMFADMNCAAARYRELLEVFEPTAVTLDPKNAYVEEPGGAAALDAVLTLDLDVDVVVIDSVRGDPLELTEAYQRLHAAMRGEVLWLDDLGLATAARSCALRVGNDDDESEPAPA